jgi:hypothetical protein
MTMTLGDEPGAIERRYGKLVVIGFSDQRTCKRCLCRCDCGNVVERPVEALTAGDISACGNCRAAPAKADAPADSFAANVAKGRNAWKRHKGGGSA